MPTQEFTVHVKNQPGSLGRVAQALHSYGVNIISLATEGTRDDGTLKIVTSDPSSARKALEKEGLEFTVDEIVVASVMNRPGELAKLATKLGHAGINIISVYLLTDGKFALRVDKPDQARNLLKETIAATI
ncbi:ACT domain-containing protein [Candidatus Micrarchaeota archaeon]|nr:ACT domain-containing protein [Candidatus Micrarchaeota archaeon]